TQGRGDRGGRDRQGPPRRRSGDRRRRRARVRGPLEARAAAAARLMRATRRRTIAALLLGAALSSPASGQDRFVAIPPEQAARYHIDFARHFFASPDAEK